MNRILVIGGTGNVGRHVVSQLSATGARFRAMSRNPDLLRLPPEVDVVHGDLTVPEALDRYLQDIELADSALLHHRHGEVDFGDFSGDPVAAAVNSED
jgi:uncharacterized protein YbjT (DUF2867 family)